MSTLPTTQGKTVPDASDYKGRPADRSKTGGWTASAMILGGEVMERLTTLGIAFNLGVTILTVSTIIPSLHPPKCTKDSGSPCIQADSKQLLVLYLALYVTALGTGGLKSSVSGFGSDQFDESDEEEKKGMIKFFSWFYFFVSLGSLAAVTVLVYIQDNQGRSWGYGICAVAIVIGLLVYLSGTRKYRIKQLVGSPLTQIAVVVVAAWRKRHMQLPSDSSLLYEEDDILYVEEVKMIIRMLPIWATTIMFWTIHAQMTTFSVSQATTMDCYIGKSFEIPAASMTVFLIGTILLTVPLYDRFIRPVAKKVLKNSNGFTPLQRIGIGLVLSVLSMVAAALIEIKRLNFARSHGFLDNPTAKMPLSVFWLVPQFSFVGAGEAFMYMGQLDFFLRECPKGMKTMSTGLFLSTLSIGFFISSLLVTIVNNVTGPNKPWIADNLNRGRLYDFYWLLAMLSAINVLIYLACAKWYVYKEKRLAEQGIELEEIEASTFHA
ncbi:hypothetical protein TSUD_231520 [Trifolium subterraneum]|nr:hypothetical protein TSUD_231520 [Trifolium subterraneum]